MIICIHIFRYKYCQSQVGSSDCGAFALAFASAIAKGDDPSQYTYDQMQMRDHLHRCLSRGNFIEGGLAAKLTKLPFLQQLKFIVSAKYQIWEELRWHNAVNVVSD